MTHYTDGQIPLTAEVKQFGVSQLMNRIMIFFVESPEWDEGTGLDNPMIVEFVGRKVAAWDEKGQPVHTQPMNDNPKIQF
jgi:hypothetical protein